MAKITKNDEGKVVSLADEEELRRSTTPCSSTCAVRMRLRSELPRPARSTSCGTATRVTYDPSKFPQDKDTPSCSTEAARARRQSQGAPESQGYTNVHNGGGPERAKDALGPKRSSDVLIKTRDRWTSADASTRPSTQFQKRSSFSYTRRTREMRSLRDASDSNARAARPPKNTRATPDDVKTTRAIRTPCGSECVRYRQVEVPATLRRRRARDIIVSANDAKPRDGGNDTYASLNNTHPYGDEGLIERASTEKFRSRARRSQRCQSPSAAAW